MNTKLTHIFDECGIYKDIRSVIIESTLPSKEECKKNFDKCVKELKHVENAYDHSFFSALSKIPNLKPTYRRVCCHCNKNRRQFFFIDDRNLFVGLCISCYSKNIGKNVFIAKHYKQ